MCARAARAVTSALPTPNTSAQYLSSSIRDTLAARVCCVTRNLLFIDPPSIVSSSSSRLNKKRNLRASPSLSLCRFFNQWRDSGRVSVWKKVKKVRIEGRVGDANSAFNKVSHGCHLNTVAYSLFSSRLAIIEEESESREREEKKIKGGRKGGRKMERGERRRG